MFQVPPDGTAVFGNTFTPAANQVVYVVGNAQLDQAGATAGLNLEAFIVDGNLDLANNTYGASYAGPPTTLSLPVAYQLEDPYGSCVGSALGHPECRTGGPIHRHADIRGFLYVTGNLTVKASTNWTIMGGAVRVDGTLRTEPNSTFYIYYNPVVNHNIRTSNFDVQIDSISVAL